MILRKVIATLLAAAPILAAHAGDATCQEPRVTEFSVPAAATTASPICGQNCGTIALDLNDEGTVVGYYTDANVVPHGFIRARDRRITTFDAPGAGLGANLDEGTVPYSINDFGVIAGQFQDSFPGAQLQVAQTYAARGEIDSAFAALAAAAADRAADSELLQIQADAYFRSLHGDPRYQALLRQLGFPASGPA